MKIADLPKEVKPREKAIRYGIKSLSDSELLALLIGSGVRGCSALEIGENLLKKFIKLPELANANLHAIQSQKGLGGVRSLNLLAAFELHRRLMLPIYSYAIKLEKRSEIYQRYRYLEEAENERLILVMLNRKKEIIHELTMYEGTQYSFSFNLKEIMKELVSSGCSYYILIHNHPDGAQNPSQNDVFLTAQIMTKSKDLGIFLLEHLIIYRGGFYSFTEKKNFSMESIYLV